MSANTHKPLAVRKTLLAGTIAALLTGANVQAGGFALIEQGGSGMGNAYAGASAVAADASTVWFNPAGMLELDSREFAVAGHVIGVNSDFADRGSTLNAAFGLTAVPGDTNVDAGGATFLPNLYYVAPLNDNMSWGVGISVPFGNSTEYDRDWVGRYQAVESGVSVIDINPSFAYRVNEKFSVGAGISVQIMNATLGNSVDSGATCLGLVSRGSVDLAQCAGAQLTAAGVRANDGYAEINGDSVDATFNLGLLYKPSAQTKLGVAYRHKIDHSLDGDADFETNPGLAAVLAANSIPLFVNGGATAEANLPGQVMMSLAHQLNDKVELLGDVSWTGWSSFEELRIVFDNPAQPDTFNTQGYEDVVRLSAGLNYAHSNKLTLRAGWAFDEDPVPSPQLRTARIPGNDRTWIAFGAGYKFRPNMSVDVGFAHLFVDDTPIANASESAGGTTIRGVYDTDANIISAQFNWLIK